MICYSEGEFWFSILTKYGECFDGALCQSCPVQSLVQSNP